MTAAVTAQTIEGFIAGAGTSDDDPLIKRGRYQIVPPGGGKPKAHTRITNFAKKLEDDYALTGWKQRMTLLGAAHRPDIVVAALANSDDKAVLGDLAEAAMDAAKANVSRETGSALHRLCERIDAGETLDLPEPWRSDVAAYTQALADLGATVELVETVVIYERLGLAGRLDRTVLIDGERFILDLKTGADLSYSWGAIAVQLACYAGASAIYDPETKKHSPMPACNQERAIVLHLPAAEGKCTPHFVNLEAGRHGIALTEAVMEWRRGTKHLATTTPVSNVARPELREYVADRVRYVIGLQHGAELARTWPEGVPTLKASTDHTELQLDLILVACDLVEGRHAMPFPALDDPRKTRL